MGRRLLLVAFLIPVLIFLGLVSGIIFIPLDAYIEHTVSQATSFPVSIGRVHLSLRGGVIINEVSVGSKNAPWLTISEIRVRPHWMDLLNKKFSIARVTVLEPTITWDEFRPPPPSTTNPGGKGLAGLGFIKRLDMFGGQLILPKTPGIGPIDLQCSFQNQRVRLNSLSAKMDNGALTGNGQIALDTGIFEFQADVRDLSLDRLVRGVFSLPADREIHYTGHGSGRGTFAQWGFQTNGYLVHGIGSNKLKILISLNGAFDGPKGNIETHLEGPSLEATTKVAIDKKRQWVEGQFHMALTSLAGMGPLWAAVEGARGSVTLKGNVKGPWKSPDFSAQAEGNQLGYGPITVDHLTAKVDRKGAKSNPLAFEVNVSSLLWSPAQGAPQSLPSAQLTWAGQMDQGILGAHIQLEDISFQGRGPARRDKNGFHWQWEKFVAIPAEGPPWRAASGALLNVKLPNTFEITNLKFVEEEASLTVRRFHWEKGALDIDISANHFPLQFSPFQGIVSAQIQLKGALENPQGNFDIRLSSAAMADLPPVQIMTNGTVENTLITLNEFQIAVSSFPLVQGHGVIPWGWIRKENPDQSMDVTVQAGPLDPAGLFQDIPLVQIQPGGSIKFEGRLQGRKTTLKARGHLSARVPGIKIPSWGIDARDAQVNLDATNDHYLIRDTSVLVGKGSLRLSGEGDWPTLRLDIQGDQLAIKMRRALGLKTDFKLALGGTWTEPVLTGTIGLKEATYEAKNKKTKAASDQEKPSPFLAFWDRLRMDIQTEWENNVWYRDGLTKIETQANLHVTKIREQRTLQLNGPMTLLRGSYDAYGRDFTLKSGEITFTSAEEIDPLLNIRAEHKMPQALIQLDISGTARKPILRFRSTPPMTEPDILALLALGKVPGQASSSADSGNSSGAKDLAADVVSDYLTRGVRSSGMNILDLDVIRVSPAEKGNEWTVGRYWGSKLFLSYSYNPEVSASQILKAEYTFWPRWTLVGQTGSNSDDYLDVIFRWPIRDRKKKKK